MTIFFNTANKAYSLDGTNWHSASNPLFGWNNTTVTFNPNNGWATVFITLATDIVNIDGTPNAGGTFTATSLVTALQAVFPKATSTGGTGGSTDYNALSNKPFTSVEVSKLKQLLNVDNTAQ